MSTITKFISSMHPRELKPEQATAVTTLDRHVSVTAGPGAGKTKVLVERYLHILRTNPHLNIDQIVAITFTNRAANEMRERLRKRLEQILRDAAGDERRRWMHYKRTLDGAVITTIHGFCSRLLREFPVEAHIDPQFMLLDEHQAATLLETAVEESLTEFINTGHDAVSRITAGVGRGRLAAALVELYRNVRNQGLSISKLSEQAAASHSNWNEYLSVMADVDQAINDLISTRRLSPKAEERRRLLEDNWPAVRQLLLDQALPIPEYCREIVELKDIAKLDARPPIAALVRRIQELFWGEKPRTYGHGPRLRFDLVAKEYSCEALQVLRSIDHRLEQTKRQLAVMDYDDLQIRSLRLLEQPEVLLRAARRYKFFLIDEFQDTNPMQRDLMNRLALSNRKDANLFIVGDPKQSIYGFRGADVGVFSEMTQALVQAGGAELPLHSNFRSQPPLINFFNLLFSRLFQSGDEVNPADLNELGFVKHEPSVAERETRDEGPLVELLVDTITSDNRPWKNRQTARERDAQQLAHRINALVNPTEEGAQKVECRHIALLFRAMTGVTYYESAFRRANIPYQTVLGRGFYEREEITDLIQLLRFLDNRTDEIALAAVLRSPLCGISDNALLALRLAPKVGETVAGHVPKSRRTPRKLFQALRKQAEIDFIAPEERVALDRAKRFLYSLIEKRNRYPVGDLLRFAVKDSEYMTVIAANFDGGQRLANVEKLFSLAERFERSGAHLIRDFVKYVHDFEAIGSRESEGQLDETANAVTFMTIHQAKGLEFPVVVLPDLQRIQAPRDNWFLLDRHLGLTLKVPDGRDNQVMGDTFKKFSDRLRQRELFESLRLMYVAATRAEDRLILSGATDDLSKLSFGRDCWLKWIWQALELENARRSDSINLTEEVQLQLELNLSDSFKESVAHVPVAREDSTSETDLIEPGRLFPLLQPVARTLDSSGHRFSVTQLINYQRCPRQYYFDRILHVPSPDEIAVWNDAESPEPPANLNATLKGSVIHRFCELYATGDDADARLKQSFEEVLRVRQAQMADRLIDIDPAKAIEELIPLAHNYLRSEVFKRIENVRAQVGKKARRFPEDAAGPDDPQQDPAGLWSELSFRLRRQNGLITGTIDKLLISRAPGGDGFEVEIIDFKTNRFRRSGNFNQPVPQTVSDSREESLKRQTASRSSNQFSFNFDIATNIDTVPVEAEPDDLREQVRDTAADYHLQMQAYALAVRQLIPNLASSATIKVTLHFLQPDIEFRLPEDLLEPDACASALDAAMLAIVSSAEPREFPVYPATHCRMCNFLEVCAPGREWLAHTQSSERSPFRPVVHRP